MATEAAGSNGRPDDDVLSRIIHMLPGRNGSDAPVEMRTITVRLPAHLHDILKHEATVRSTSTNKLIVAKLSVRSDVIERAAEIEARH